MDRFLDVMRDHDRGDTLLPLDAERLFLQVAAVQGIERAEGAPTR
jgi:hypothetical protein